MAISISGILMKKWDIQDRILFQLTLKTNFTNFPYETIITKMEKEKANEMEVAEKAP